MDTEKTKDDLALDAAELYREEIVTDRRAGTIRVLTPVRADGSADSDRPTLFFGETQILTNVGALPLSFPLEATSLAEAVQKFSESARRAIEEAVEEVKEMRRQAASSIVVPDMGGGLGGLPGPGRRGPGPGGGIQLP